MQNPSLPYNITPLRSPTPPLESCSDDWNDLEQELARNDAKRTHFLDYDPVPPTDFNSIQPRIQPSATDALTNDAQHANGIVKREAVGMTGAHTKKHFLDENPIPPDYDYQHRHHRSLDREYDRNGRNEICKVEYERRHSIERAKQVKKPIEPSNVPSRFLETNDDRMNGGDGGVHYGKNNAHVGTGASEQREPKVDCVYSLLSVIGCDNSADISGKFLELSEKPGTSQTLRRCISWLVAAIHMETDEITRKQARQTLHNVIHQQDDKCGRREAKVLRHIEQIMDYCDSHKQNKNVRTEIIDSDSHPLQVMSSLMKVSISK